MKVTTPLNDQGIHTSKFIDYLDLLVLIPIFGLFCIYSCTTPTIENFGSDTSIYFELAKSLLQDHRYWFNFEPHTTYPPGFPLLLACTISLVGKSFEALVKVNALISFFGLIGTYFLIKLLKGRKTALSVIMLTVTSYAFYFFSTSSMLSDVPYFTSTVYALLFFELGNRTNKRWAKAFLYILVAFLTAYITQIRSIGIAFTGGFLLWMANPFHVFKERSQKSSMERIKKWCPVALLSIGLFSLWIIWCSQNRTQPYSGDYMSSYSQQLLKENPHQIDSPNITLKQVPSRILNMLLTRSADAGRMIYNVRWLNPKWTNPLVSLLFIILFVGFSVSLMQQSKLLDWYILTYLGILLLWPFHEGTRFLFPIQPFLYLYIIISLDILYDFVKSNEFKKYYPLCGIFFGSMLVYSLVQIFLNDSISRQDIMSIGVWFLLCSYVVMMYFWKSDQTVAFRNTEALSSNRPAKRAYLYTSLKIVLLVVIIGAGGFQIFSQAMRNVYAEPSTFRHYPAVQASRWIIDNTHTADVIMADNYAILHRLTKRKTFRFPLSTDTKALRDTIIMNNVKYIVVLNEKEYEYYLPSTIKRFSKLQKVCPTMFSLVHNLENGRIYEVK